ncbi:hypothetical protein PSHT_01362 [Puccinia striiformis]|uniref:Uncharacterized protein n=1 Tax=Puccinia striiformis TaxID=27350 RepID=A0A2S4WL10_9BASI|nr:hypothetical protein PSHT_01362 [Puccinia striiformis]
MATLMLIFLVYGTGVAHQQIQNHGTSGPSSVWIIRRPHSLCHLWICQYSRLHWLIGVPEYLLWASSRNHEVPISHWVFWLPGFVAVGGFGLLHRFLNPYEEAAREPIGIRSTMSTVNKAREIR